MEIPKYHQTIKPILEVLKDGKILKTRVLIKEVKTKFYFNLTDEQLKQTTKSGEILIDNRISWGKADLKKDGYIYFPERGLVQITEQGQNYLATFTLTDVKIEAEPRITDSPQDLIDEGFNSIEMEVKNNLLQKLKQIDPYFFEKVVLKLLKKMGYGEFIETPRSNDGGIDGIINEDKLGLDKIYIQAKRFNEGKVREKDIRNFIGAMSGDTHKGVFVTTSVFDDKALEKARSAHHKIICIDGQKLVALMYEFNVGTQIKTTYEIKQIDEDFFNES